MNEYPFNLKGQQRSFSGRGNKDGETWKSVEFQLRQGILVTEISHHGRGDFKLNFVATEGLSGGEATATGIGGGAIAGAAVGSVVPIVGTIAGGLLGAAAGAFFGEDVIGRAEWTPAETKGQFSTYDIVRVAESSDDALPPGKYRIEVESKARWECRFIQPDLGQPQFSLTDEDEEEEEIEGGLYIIGPCEPARRPIRANIVHKGLGEFGAFAYSLDGTHWCVIREEQGQFHTIDQVATEIRPGKEYMFLINAEGEWNLTFSEGY